MAGAPPSDRDAFNLPAFSRDEYLRLMEQLFGNEEQVQELAELVWQRVTLWEERAEREARRIEALLQQAERLPMGAERQRWLGRDLLALLLEGEGLIDEVARPLDEGESAGRGRRRDGRRPCRSRR